MPKSSSFIKAVALMTAILISCTGCPACYRYDPLHSTAELDAMCRHLTVENHTDDTIVVTAVGPGETRKVTSNYMQMHNNASADDLDSNFAKKIEPFHTDTVPVPDVAGQGAVAAVDDDANIIGSTMAGLNVGQGDLRFIVDDPTPANNDDPLFAHPAFGGPGGGGGVSGVSN